MVFKDLRNLTLPTFSGLPSFTDFLLLELLFCRQCLHTLVLAVLSLYRDCDLPAACLPPHGVFVSQAPVTSRL